MREREARNACGPMRRKLINCLRHALLIPATPGSRLSSESWLFLRFRQTPLGSIPNAAALWVADRSHARGDD